MTYIKRMVMHGFKSFARKTEIPMENVMNVIVGPNGSGKSNITDALCFVLGRLSIKSIRAAKAANLLFTGNKTYKGSQEASVELVFDNTDKSFAVDTPELSIKRIVRKNGQSIYKINHQTKTRQDLLEILSQAGIDPNGFNIVLQGEIQSLVKSSAEDRRKIIEEVAGISIYETRKHKSIRELEKTEEKLKEVSAVLKERNSYLKNLEKERQEAVQWQNLESTIKRCKATLLSKEMKEKEKEIWGTEKSIENNEKEIKNLKKKIADKNLSMEELQNKIKIINKKIQASTSSEQETLHKELSDLKANLAGLKVRKENFETRLERGHEKQIDYKEKMENLDEEISKIQTASPEIKKQQEKHKVLQEKLDILEKHRRRFYILKSELSTAENQKSEKEKFLIESKKEIQLIEQNIESLFNEIKYGKSLEKVSELKKETKSEINSLEEKISGLREEILEKEKRNAVLEMDIKREEKLSKNISGLEICPICKQNVEEGHKHKISSGANQKINSAKGEFEKNVQTRVEDTYKIEKLEKRLSELKTKENELEIDELKIKNSVERKENIKRISASEKEAKEDLKKINEKIHIIRSEFEKLKDIETKYDEARMNLQELGLAEMDVDTEITLKRKEVNRLDLELKSTIRDIEESEVELKKITTIISEQEKLFLKKEIEEQKLYEKCEKFFNEKNGLQDQEKVLETDIMGFQHNVRNFEEKINHSKIQKAQYNAQIDSLKTELSEFGNVELIQAPIDQIRDRLQKAQFRISKFGSVNMRALEAFETVQEQCTQIQEKVETIEKEKETIEKIVAEIDKKKKKSFLTTLNAVNQYFTRNFSQLSRKGEVFLELENKKEPFEGGLNILVKVSRGRYFDIASLSGGEKTMVALSLIFAIQEYKPYCFYIFDEIDAALDKHNSELLAALIKKYMKTGQYIIITHNDTLISESTNLFGVSMQENISKIVSLKV